MAEKKSSICEFGKKAAPFTLLGTDGSQWSLERARGAGGTLVMFICNHCPYVQAIVDRLVEDTTALMAEGVGCIAIMSNDTKRYSEDSYENMQRFAREENLPFPYVIDETQEIARTYGAICTPDFFGYNRDLALQYRGRLDSAGAGALPKTGTRTADLLLAMRQIIKTGKGPAEQNSSVGCSIKWRDGT